ncbi:MAG: DUF3106 domain-containing protein [Deltaproteobacteria bacterium]|nr:MAG: DUF3106 domain-containing protein [Deltaproteobacteria bacterium]
MRETIREAGKSLTGWCIVSTLCFWLVISFSSSAWCQSKRPGRERSPVRGLRLQGGLTLQNWAAANQRNGRWTRAGSKENKKVTFQNKKDRGKRQSNYQNLSPGEKDKLKNKYQRWESLPPEKRQQLRRRMERWKGLSAEERQLFRRRYEQWREISPEERQNIKRQLEMWDKLTPQEREKIRQRFRNP